MSRRKRTPRTPRAMKIDYDRDLDSLLDQSMARLGKDMANIDDRLDAAMSDMEIKLEKAMFAVKKATVHSPDVPLKTKVAANGVTDHVLKAAQQIQDMKRGRRTKKQTVTFTDRYMMEDPGPAEYVWSEDVFGNLKQPITESLRLDTKVRVSSRPVLSELFLPNHPKYQVFVGNDEVHMQKMEEMMYRSSLMGSGNNGGIFVESWLKGWTNEEVHFLQQALKGITALKLNRKYHDETLSVLDKRLSKQRDGDGDVGDSVGTDGGS